jgi:hypothetical protein
MQDLSKWGRRPKDRKKRNPDKIVDSVLDEALGCSDLDGRYELPHLVQ